MYCLAYDNVILLSYINSNDILVTLMYMCICFKIRKLLIRLLVTTLMFLNHIPDHEANNSKVNQHKSTATTIK